MSSHIKTTSTLMLQHFVTTSALFFMKFSNFYLVYPKLFKDCLNFFKKQIFHKNLTDNPFHFPKALKISGVFFHFQKL